MTRIAPAGVSREPSVSERLQKKLASAGFGSRREIERWIAEGRVRIDGRVAQLGDGLTGGERVEVDGRVVRLQAPQPRLLAYHKNAGEITARHDPEGRPTVFASLPRAGGGRWIAIGRLDLNTSGLLLLTTDGELANRMMHPSYQVERTYAVRVLGGLDETQRRALQEGVLLDDGPARVQRIWEAGGEGANRWYHLVLTEGRQREVRRLIERVGGEVSRLIRIGYGPIVLSPRLRRGRFEAVPPEQVRACYQAVGLPAPRPVPPARTRRPARPGAARGPRRR